MRIMVMVIIITLCAALPRLLVIKDQRKAHAHLASNGASVLVGTSPTGAVSPTRKRLERQEVDGWSFFGDRIGAKGATNIGVGFSEAGESVEKGLGGVGKGLGRGLGADWWP
jgi:hypothetical protein